MLQALKRYSLQIIFTLSLLLGLQLPHFLQQYELRVEAHLAEAELQLAQFQSLADAYFDGDLNALIKKHRNSDISLFRDEADVIEASYLRVQLLQHKMAHINEPVWLRLVALSKEIKQPLFNETWQGYQANIVLNQQAITIGVILAIVLTLTVEVFIYFVTYLIKRFFFKPKRQVS